MKKKKKHKEIAAGIGLIILGGVLAFGITQTTILDNLNTSKTQKIEYDKEVTISTGIRPYRTNINSNQTIKFKNKRSNPINITFETNSISEHIYIEGNQSGYFKASKYDNLPFRNYYNLESGDTGEIVVN